MDSQLYVIKSNIVVEPLVNFWYAWINLFSPLTCSFYFVHQQTLLNSYITFPAIHHQAANAKKLAGGNFVNLDAEVNLDAIKNIYSNSLNILSDNINFVESFKKANKLLLTHGVTQKGFSDVYNKIPEILRGYVELVYDINHMPSVRFIEPLLYNSIFYKPELQSVLFYEINPDERTFILSTPRISPENSLNIHLPFSSEFYDKIFIARKNPLSEINIKTLYNLYLSDLKIDFDLFKSIFLPIENTAAKKHLDSQNNATEIFYYGHACVLIKSRFCNIIIDPFVTYKNDCSRIQRLSYEDLPDSIDYVILTHSHQDHTVLETLIQIRHKIKNIIVPYNHKGALQDPSLKLFLAYAGFKNIYEISEMDTISINGGKIYGLPFLGEHADLNINSKLAYLVCIDNKSLLFMSDSKNQEENIYRNIKKIIPGVDVIFIGLECKGAPLSWLYGPLMPNPLPRSADLTRRLSGSDAREAFDIINILEPKKVFIYAMGHEPWLKFISNLERDENSEQFVEAEKLVKLCKEKNIACKILYGSQQLIF